MKGNTSAVPVFSGRVGPCPNRSRHTHPRQQKYIGNSIFLLKKSLFGGFLYGANIGCPNSSLPNSSTPWGKSLFYRTHAPNQQELTELVHRISQRVAIGPQQGCKVFTLQTIPARERQSVTLVDGVVIFMKAGTSKNRSDSIIVNQLKSRGITDI